MTRQIDDKTGALCSAIPTLAGANRSGPGLGHSTATFAFWIYDHSFASILLRQTHRRLTRWRRRHHRLRVFRDSLNTTNFAKDHLFNFKTGFKVKAYVRPTWHDENNLIDWLALMINQIAVTNPTFGYLSRKCAQTRVRRFSKSLKTGGLNRRIKKTTQKTLWSLNTRRCKWTAISARKSSGQRSITFLASIPRLIVQDETMWSRIRSRSSGGTWYWRLNSCTELTASW